VKIAVLCIATGKYINLFEQFRESVLENFCKDHEVDIVLFTNSSEDFGKKVKKITIERGGWPKDTLHRYHYFLSAREMLINYDYLFYLDVDMKVVGKVSDEIFGNLVSTLHPGFYGKNDGTFERRKKSTAYVPDWITSPYFCGGFQGGSTENFLDACQAITENIDIDARNNIMAIWHDESHWNSYLKKNPPDKVLDPSYCYPTDANFPWVSEFEEGRKIITVEKDENALRADISEEERYKDFLRGKRVALVGPSKTVMMQENGQLIDSYDIVVRLNNMLGFDKSLHKHLGSRTDVVYATLDDPPKKMAIQCIKNSVKYLSSSYPKDEWFFSKRMKNNVELLKHVDKFCTVTLPSEPYFTIKKETNSRPNTGFSAIIDLLSSELEELYITGVDFYRSLLLDEDGGYYTGYDCQWTNKKKKDYLQIEYDGPDKHDPDRAFLFFKNNMHGRDKRIKLDPIFNSFMNDERFEKII